jgi:hypothetical protein
MSKGKRARRNRGDGRRVSVRAIRRDQPDAKKLSQAIIALAITQIEADARADHQRPSSDIEQRSA